MIRKKKFLFVSAVLTLAFVASTNYLLATLTSSQIKSVHDKIYVQLENLPQFYKHRKPLENDIFDKFIKNLYLHGTEKNISKLWATANSWVSKNKLVNGESPFIGSISLALKKAKIIKADLDTRGTQLKLLLTLEGHQDVIFKPKWYDRTKLIEGPVYGGKDRHSSEIIAFYLSIILNMPLTPFSVERIISLTHDIMPVATKRLINTSFNIENRTCIYGKCFYCKKEDPVCEDRKLFLHGAIIFNVNSSFKSYRSPWQRTYKKDKRALWEKDDHYCRYIKEKLTQHRLLDLIDVSIFDFLIQNGDRHHYETLYDSVVLLDNGKGFGNPYVSHLDILAPLYQCCLLRNKTLLKLLNVAGGNLKKKLEAMPNIENLLTSHHLKALEERLLIIFATIEYCKNENKSQ